MLCFRSTCVFCHPCAFFSYINETKTTQNFKHFCQLEDNGHGDGMVSTRGLGSALRFLLNLVSLRARLRSNVTGETDVTGFRLSRPNSFWLSCGATRKCGLGQSISWVASFTPGDNGATRHWLPALNGQRREYHTLATETVNIRRELA